MIKLRPLVPAFPPTPKPALFVPKKLPEPEVLILEEECTTLALHEASEKRLLAAKASNSWVDINPDKNLVQVIAEARETGYRTGGIMEFLKKLDEDFKDIVAEYYRVKKLWEAKVAERAYVPPAPQPYFNQTQYHFTPPPPRQKEYYSYTPPPQRSAPEPKKEVQFFKEHVDPKIVEKVQKLLRLSESMHKGEAEAAMHKAREISSKYGIILESVSKY